MDKPITQVRTLTKNEFAKEANISIGHLALLKLKGELVPIQIDGCELYLESQIAIVKKLASEGHIIPYLPVEKPAEELATPQISEKPENFISVYDVAPASSADTPHEEKAPAQIPAEPKKAKKQSATPKKKENPNAIKFSFDEKKFLYSGDLSDLDFARRIEFVYGGIIRYLQDTNCWLILDKNNQGGGVWKNRGEKKAVIEPYALNLADALISNAVPMPKPLEGDLKALPKEITEKHKQQVTLHEYQVSLGKHLKKQKNRTQAIESMKGSWNLIVHPEDLNKPKHLLNVLNGVVDLRTKELLPLDPNYLIMNQAGAAYDPDADTTFVENFLAEVIPDPQTRRAVLRYLLLDRHEKLSRQRILARASGRKWQIYAH